MNRPLPPTIIPDGIPAELRQFPKWVNWRYEWVTDKWTKVLVNSKTGANAASNRPQTWCDFEFALLQSPQWDGIGFVLTGDEDLVGIDLDHCIGPDGVIEQWAADIVLRFQSYTETTPSGTGFRIYIHGKLPPGGRKKGNTEVYETGRFLTVTGQHFAAMPRTIETRQAELVKWHKEVFGVPEPPKPSVPRPPGIVSVGDREVLELAWKATNGTAIKALYNGATNGYNGDDSAADAALCAHLGFYCGGDAGQVDRIFRSSGLWREKWDQKHSADGRTYGQMTIDKALSGLTEYYTPPSNGQVIIGGAPMRQVAAVTSIEPFHVPTETRQSLPETTTDPQGKLYAVPMEQATIGAMLRSVAAIVEATDVLEAPDFGVPRHGQVFDLVKTLFGRGEAATPLTIAAALDHEPWFHEAGGVGWLHGMCGVCEDPAHAATYAARVREKADRRALLEAAQAVQAAVHSEATTGEVMEQSGQKIIGLGSRSSKSEWVTIGELGNSTITYAEACAANKGPAGGIMTGFHEIDKITGGLLPQQLAIVAGRPGMGKTSLVAQIAYHVALKLQQRVGVFSLEMSKDQWVRRIICTEARINSLSMRQGILTPSDMERMDFVNQELQLSPMFIHDSPTTSMFKMRSSAMALAAKHGQLGLIVIDFLQRVTMGDGKRHGNRTEEVGEIARSCKQLAREMNAPVIALAALSRSVDSRDDKRPVLSDLRESGDIESEADVVAMIYRADYYRKPKQDGNKTQWGPLDGDESMADIGIEKQRDGAMGVSVRLGFDAQFARFENLVRYH